MPNEYLLEKVEVVNFKKTNQPKESFEAFYRQKPNRKLFRTIHFFVWWYNLFDENKIKEKRAERNLKYDKINSERVLRTEKKNEKRRAKGKKEKIPKLKDKTSLLIIESIRDIGEPAIIFDSTLTEQTRLQMVKFLFSKGYFNNTVTDTIEFKKDKKRAIVKYYLHPKKPYTINSITYLMEDEKLGALVFNDSINRIIDVGDQYDADKLQTERQRITDFALNNGYFYFENAYINFDVDSNYDNHSVSIVINLKKFAKSYSSTNDSLIFINHPRLKVQNVYIITEAVYKNVRDVRFTDTVKTKRDGTVFLLNEPLSYRQPIILNNTDIYRGQWFRKDTSELTYKQLLGLGIFKNVTIQFLRTPDFSNRLDCYIICNPLLKQSLTAETEGTNTNGNLGIDGSIIYQNKNFFRGGELIELKLQAAISAQKQLSKDTTYIGSITDIADLGRLQRTFNTIQFGPEFTFSVPRAFFPFSLIPFKKDMLPRTYIKSSLNYQSRPEFSRIITNINYGFSFKSNKGRLRHDFIPFEAYSVQANLLQSFKNDLGNLQDAFLLNSFQDHITTLSKYGLTYTSKSNNSTKPLHYFRWTIASSGSILRQYFKSTGAKPDSLDRYLIFGIPFAQFVKTDIDYRINIPIRKGTRLVYRLAGGIGKPLKNLSGLPYEQSYFSGGPNSVRAWRARTLGPGGYDPSNSSTSYDKIGDILLEGNVEYRFHIIKSFNGAFFVDAGNIWRLKKDETKPNGEFMVENFIDQIAIGSGFGLRWDLNFFVLRLDMAAPVKDPKYAVGDRWTYDKQPWKQIVANFGIGYPF
ncbi:MAG: BamA/TamA family outer membrane protein [Bacteroidota bacterium]|nr:BamA/TamA family outer membrane protein [Bacteroidota bacterium]MDP3555891.1 BamA/TamA family outer membrane protein [Bacteroidota bacterium]